MIRATLVVAAISLLQGAALVSGASRVCAQSLSPFSDFQNLEDGSLQTVQMKLEYLGPMLAAIPPVVLWVGPGTYDPSIFAPYRRPAISYWPDSERLPYRDARITASEMSSAIAAAGSVPEVVAGGVSSPAIFSFALSRTDGAVRVYESILEPAAFSLLLRELRPAVASADAAGLLRGTACTHQMTTLERPVDRTADVTVSVSAFRRVPDTRQFAAEVTIQNVSATALPAPVSLLIDFDAPQELASPDGTPCTQSGVWTLADYLNLPGSLAPGESVALELLVKNSSLVEIRPSFRLLAGPGDR